MADGRGWLGYGPRLAELDVSEPAAPVLVRTSEPLGHIVSTIANDASRVYVAAGRTIYAFPMEGALTPLGAVSHLQPILKMVHSHGFLYALAGDRPGPDSDEPTNLVVVDVRNPSAMRVGTEIVPEGVFVDLAVRGQTLFATSRVPVAAPVGEPDGTATLHAFSLASGAAPRAIGTVRDTAMGLIATNATAPRHLAAVSLSRHSNGGLSLAVFDVTDPARIRLIERPDAGVWNVAGLVMTSDGTPALAFGGGFGGSGITVPPTAANGGNGTVYYGGALAAGAFATDGTLLYFSAISGRLTVADPAVPGGAVRHLDMLGSVTDVAVNPALPSTAIVAIQEGGLRLVGIANSQAITVTSLGYNNRIRRRVESRGDFVAADSLGEGDGFDPVVEVFRIHDERNVQKEAEVPMGSISSNFALASPWLYTIDLDFGEFGAQRSLAMWDIGQRPPAKVMSQPLAGSVQDMAVNGRHLTIARYTDSNPGEHPMRPEFDLANVGPWRLRTVSAPEIDEGVVQWWMPMVARTGDLVYAVVPVGSDREELAYRLYVVDVAPRDASVVASMDLPGKPTALSVADGFALIGITCPGASGTCGYAVLDLADPRAPRQAGWIEAPYGGTLEVFRGRVYVGAFDSGLAVYEPDIPWRFEEPTPTPSPTASATPTATPLATERVSGWRSHLPSVRTR